MKKEARKMSIKTLIDLSISSGRTNRVNFCALRMLLKCFAMKLNMIDEDIGTYVKPRQWSRLCQRLRGGTGEEEENSQTVANAEENAEPVAATGEPAAPAPKPDPSTLEDEAPAKEEGSVAPSGEAATVAASDDPKAEKAPEPGEESIPEGENAQAEVNRSPSSVMDRAAVPEYVFTEDDLLASFSSGFLFHSSDGGMESTLFETDDSIIRIIDTSDTTIEPEIGLHKLRDMAEKWDFALFSIGLLIDSLVTNSFSEEQHLKLCYLKEKMLGHNYVYELSEYYEAAVPFVPRAAPAKRPSKTESSSTTMSDTTTEKKSQNKKSREFALLKEQLCQMGNKVNDLTAAFLEKNFEPAFERLEELLEESRQFSKQIMTVFDRIDTVERQVKTCLPVEKMLKQMIYELDRKKISGQELIEVLDTKPDFTHLKKKLAIVDFVQYKYSMQDDMNFMQEAIDSIAQKMNILEEIGQILYLLKKADWKKALREEFEAKITQLRCDFNEILKAKEKCHPIGVPLLCNMPIQKSKKMPDDKCPTKSPSLIPSVEELAKACKEKLRDIDNKPFRLPPKDYLYRGATTANKIRRSPSAANVCGKATRHDLKR